MSLLNNNNKKGSGKNNKNTKPGVPGAKTQIKPGKAASFAKKPIKTGGTRGS